MLVSLKWLSKYVDISGYTPSELANKISFAGLEVEEVKYLAKGTNLVIGQILEVRNHPSSDHLHLLKVDVKDEVLDIVCGASNVKESAKVIVAREGAYLEAIDLTIKKSTIRGEISNGMCCSYGELGVDQKLLNEEEINGIVILDETAEVGNSDPLGYLGLDDVILDVSLTPNRGDCMSMWGIATDIAAIIGKKANLDKITYEESKKSSLQIEVLTNKCSIFSLRKVNGIKVGNSPKWLKSILQANNIKSINNIVDLGNYIMLTSGQPLHMYDFDKLTSNKFVIHDSFEGSVKMLDEKDYHIENNDIVITNDHKVECLGGVMGSYSSMIDSNTKNIVIEAASFDSPSVRKTSRRLNLISESSQRFVKGTDKFATKDVLDFCVNTLRKLTSIDSVEEIVSFSNLETSNKKINLPYASIKKLLGFEIEKKEIEKIFTNLDFKFNLKDDTYFVSVPTRRNDLLIKEDLIEEIVRIYGFSELKGSLPFNSENKGSYSLTQQKRKLIRDYLINNGLYETLNYNLVDSSLVNLFDYMLKGAPLKIENPLSEEHRYLRRSLLPSLLKTINHNVFRGNKDLLFFENSQVYANEEEKELLSIALHGEFKSTPHLGASKVDFSIIKGLLEGLLAILLIDKSRLVIEKNNDMKDLHPYRSGKIYLDKTYVGFIGEVHPSVLEKFSIERTYVLEIDLSKLMMIKGSKIKFSKLNIYPSINRDVALVVKKDIEADKIIKSISKVDRSLIQNVSIFDVYEGEHIEKGYKSLAFSLTYQSKEKTLLDEEVNLLHKKVIEMLISEFNAVIR